MGLDDELARIAGEDQLGASIIATAQMAARLYHELIGHDVPAQSATIIVGMYMGAVLQAAAMKQRGNA